jgi:hypothetical protein
MRSEGFRAPAAAHWIRHVIGGNYVEKTGAFLEWQPQAAALGLSQSGGKAGYCGNLASPDQQGHSDNRQRRIDAIVNVGIARIRTLALQFDNLTQVAAHGRKL